MDKMERNLVAFLFLVHSNVARNSAGRTKADLLKGGDYWDKWSFFNQTNPAKGPGSQPRVKQSLSLSSFVKNSPTEDDPSVSFLLFTPENQMRGHVLETDKWETFFTSSWTLNRQLKMIVHDYKGNCGRDIFSTQMISAYMSSGKVANLVCMDWRNLAQEENFSSSAEKTGDVGRQLSEFINYVKRAGFVRNYTAIHIIGYGLGAHVAGVAGSLIVQRREGHDLIGRITGLDPSGPGFGSTTPANDKLDPKDASFVDVIHTNMGTIRQGYLGTIAVSGHADFYPNGGTFQPSCGSSIVGDTISTCSHLESVKLFANSIRGIKYPGCKCTDWISFIRGECGECKKRGSSTLMGESSSKATTLGLFFLRT